MPVFRVLSRKSTLAALIVLTAAVASLPATLLAQTAGQIPPELISYSDQIYVNGKIITVDRDFSIREAVAVRDGRILAVGTTAAIQRYAGPKTQRIDLAGKTMVPGIMDTHVHLQSPLPADQASVMAKEPKCRDYQNTAKIDGKTLQEVAPVASILKAGGRVAGHGEGVAGDSFFNYASMLVTRTNSKGAVWGKADAIDRNTMLRMFTIWAAEYFGRADRLGSIEAGKFADLAVLDKDFMAVPDTELKTIKVLLTVVGGKVVYQAPTFKMAN